MTVTSQALNKSYGKNAGRGASSETGRDDADVTWHGRSFQVRAAATGKAWSPTVDSRVRRTGSDVVSTDRRRVLIPRFAGWRSWSARCVNAIQWMHLFKNGQLELNPLQSFQLMREWSDE